MGWVKKSILSILIVLVFSSMIYNITVPICGEMTYKALKCVLKALHSPLFCCCFLEYDISAFVILPEFYSIFFFV
jgi:hypothetical protein